MHELTNLKHTLIKELEGFSKDGGLNKSSLETIDTLAHACKNVCKIIECCESDEYSHRMGRSYADGPYRETTYSYKDNPKGEIYRLIENTQDKHIKEELRRLLDRL